MSPVVVNITTTKEIRCEQFYQLRGGTAEDAARLFREKTKRETEVIYRLGKTWNMPVPGAPSMRETEGFHADD